MPEIDSIVFLVGLPGSGKTTVGKLLSASMGLPFIDLDDIIVESEGRSIKSIFEENGEDYFRSVERACLSSLIESHKAAIVSTGGGTPCFFDNTEKMNLAGTTCYLQTSWEVLASRVSPEQSIRPLFKGLSESAIEEQLTERFSWRLPYYLQASIIVNTDQRQAAEISREIREQLRK